MSAVFGSTRQRPSGLALVLALGAATLCLLLPRPGLLWLVAAPLGALAWVCAATPGGDQDRFGRKRLAALMVVGAIALAALRWEPRSLAFSASLLGAALTGLAVAQGRWGKAAGWVLGVLGAGVLAVAGLEVLGKGTAQASVLLDVRTPGDLGRLSPLAWQDLAAGLGIVSLPIVVGKGREAPAVLGRILGSLLSALLLTEVALCGGPVGVLAAVLGLLWAAVGGRWLSRWGWMALSIALVLGALGLWRILPDRGNPVRNRALTYMDQLLEDRAVAWGSAVRAVRKRPPLEWITPRVGRFGEAWPSHATPSEALVRGVEAPASSLSDPLLALVDLGAWALLAAALWFAGVAVAFRRSPGVSGALVASGAYSALVGHLYAPLNGWVTVALVVFALGRCDDPTPNPGGYSRALPGVLAALCILLAGLVPLAPRPTMPAPRAERLWSIAQAAPAEQALAAYREAARSFRQRWRVVEATQHVRDPGEVRTLRLRYADFASDYARRLRGYGLMDGARGYEALADQLRSEASGGP